MEAQALDGSGIGSRIWSGFHQLEIYSGAEMCCLLEQGLFGRGTEKDLVDAWVIHQLWISCCSSSTRWDALMELRGLQGDGALVLVL